MVSECKLFHSAARFWNTTHTKQKQKPSSDCSFFCVYTILLQGNLGVWFVCCRILVLWFSTCSGSVPMSSWLPCRTSTCWSSSPLQRLYLSGSVSLPHSAVHHTTPQCSTVQYMHGPFPRNSREVRSQWRWSLKVGLWWVRIQCRPNFYGLLPFLHSSLTFSLMTYHDLVHLEWSTHNTSYGQGSADLFYIIFYFLFTSQ